MQPIGHLYENPYFAYKFNISTDDSQRQVENTNSLFAVLAYRLGMCGATDPATGSTDSTGEQAVRAGQATADLLPVVLGRINTSDAGRYHSRSAGALERMDITGGEFADGAAAAGDPCAVWRGR